ncbi:MAG: NUDIX domain-containing protein [Clostridia bacterium]
MQDIKIEAEKINFKSRVNGIIIKDNKVLTVQMNHNGFYCLPGGHIEIGEDSKTAVLREMKEEVNIDNKIVNLVSIIENFFERKNGKKFHEISFYYLLEPINNIETKDYEIIEHDKDQDVLLEFKWIPLKDLNSFDFRPKFLKEKLQNNNFEFSHAIIKEKNSGN